MDSLDNFEFKPLTDGLGFHKKAETLKTEPKSETIAARVTESKPKREEPKPAKKAARSTFDFGGHDAMEPAALELETDHDTSDFGRDFGRPNLFSNDRDFSAEMPSSSHLSSKLKFEDDDLTLTPSKPLFPKEPEPKASENISDLIASLPPSLDFISTPKKESARAPEVASSRPQIFQPLAPRDDYAKDFAKEFKAPLGPTIGSVLPTPGTKVGASLMAPTPGTIARTPSAPPQAPPSQYRERLDESFARAFPHADRKKESAAAATTKTTTRKSTISEEQTTPGFVAIPAHFGSAILDGMVVTGISTILLVAILAITHVNLMGLLSNAQTDGPTRIHLLLLFMAVTQLYLLTARSFFRCSLGEWAFDLQLGSPEQHESAIFPLRVAARTLLLTVTGFVILPALSLAMGQDLLAGATGLQLFRTNDNH